MLMLSCFPSGLFFLPCSWKVYMMTGNLLSWKIRNITEILAMTYLNFQINISNFLSLNLLCETSFTILCLSHCYLNFLLRQMTQFPNWYFLQLKWMRWKLVVYIFHLFHVCFVSGKSTAMYLDILSSCTTLDTNIRSGAPFLCRWLMVSEVHRNTQLTVIWTMMTYDNRVWNTVYNMVNSSAVYVESLSVYRRQYLQFDQALLKIKLQFLKSEKWTSNLRFQAPWTGQCGWLLTFMCLPSDS